MKRLLLCLLLASACAAPSSEPEEAAEPAWRVATSRAGMFTAEWRPVPAPIPVNEPFELEVRLYEGAETKVPIEDAEVFINAWMPDHGHGMLREPRSEARGDGTYRVKGMLLHMDGFWQLFIDVVRDGISERAEFDVIVE